MSGYMHHFDATIAQVLQFLIRATWLDQEAARRFIKATVEAIALTMQDKEKAFASMRKWYGINDTKVLEGIYGEATDLPTKPYPSIAGLKNMQSIYTWRRQDRIDKGLVP